MKRNIILILISCVLTVPQLQAAAVKDTTKVYTTNRPLVYEDAWDLWPYVFLNESGEPDGYNIDLLKIIFKELDIPYVIKLMPTFDAQRDLHEGRSDLMLRIDADFSRSPSSYFGQSIVHLFTHSVVTPVDKNINIESGRGLSPHNVIVHEGSYSHHLIRKNKWARKIVPYDDMKEAIQAVSSQDNGIIVWNTMSLKWLMRKYHTDNLTITPIDLPYGEYKFMSGDQHLLSQIDSVYSQLRADDRLQSIQNKWFYPERKESGIPSWVMEAAAGLAIIALGFFVYYVFYRLRERKVTSAVRRSNDRLSLILKTSNVSLWTYNVLSKTFEWMDEQGNTQQRNLHLEDFVNRYRPKDVKQLQDAIDDLVLQRKENITLSIQVFEDQNRSIPYDYTLSLSVLNRSKIGHPTTILCTRSDVTKELSRQLKIKETMLRYQTIFNTVMVDMVAYDAKGYITDVNKKALAALGTDLKTILNMHFSLKDVLGIDDFDPETIESMYVTQIFRGDIDDERPLNRMLKHDVLYYELRVVPVRDSQGNLQAIFVSGRNTTEAALSYQKLRRNMREQQEINEEITDYIHNIDYVLTVGGIRIVRYNLDTHLLTLYHEAGTAGTELTQTRLMSMVDDSSKKKAERLLNNMDNQTTEPIHADIKTTIEKKGQQVFLQVHMIPTYNQEGKLVEYFGMTRDISEIKAIETKLAQETLRAQEVEVVKNAFLHNMSFEIRTPLNAVVGFAELFQMEHSPEDETIFIKEIKENSARLLLLINDILFLSRLDADMITMTTKPVDFAATIAMKCEAAWAHEKKPNVEYVVQNPFRKLVVEIDDTNISIIIEKIVLNAVEHTTSGQVLVRYDYLGDQLIVVVEDTGCGISEATLKHLFERFVTDGSDSAHAGLGLSICHDLVRHMGGTINIKSTVGKGTSAWFSIPCKALEIERK